MKTNRANKLGIMLVGVLALSAISNTCHAATLADGLVAHYELDGNALDSSSYEANGTIYGSLTPVTDRFGNPGGALTFDKNGYVSLPNTTLLNGATQAAITGWVKNRLLPGEDGFVISAGDIRSGLDPFQVRFNGNEVQEAVFTDTLMGPFSPDRFVGFEGGSGLFVAQNTWFSFVSQFTSVAGQTTYHLYINGQLALQENYARSAQVTFDRPMPIEIGAHVGSFYPTEFRGDIDDLRIYDRALTPEEIAAVSAPEPSTALLLLGTGMMLALRGKRICVLRSVPLLLALVLSINPAYKSSDNGCNSSMLGSCPREMPATYHPPSLMNFVHALSRCGKWVGVAALRRPCWRFITTVSDVGWQPLIWKAPGPSFQPSEDARQAEAEA